MAFVSNLDLETVFSVASTLALVGWVILILLPRRWSWLNALPRVIIPFALSGLYVAFLIPNIYSGGEGGFSSLEDVRALFGRDEVLLAGWIHYLAFDMLVGGFIADRSDAMRLHRVIQAPILAATFMFGPLGFLLFAVIRAFHRQDPETS